MADKYWESSPFGKDSIFNPSFEDKQKETRKQREAKQANGTYGNNSKQIGGVFYTAEGVRLGEVLPDKEVYVVSKKIIDEKKGDKGISMNLIQINNAINKSKNQSVIEKGKNDLNNYIIKYSRDTRMTEQELNLRACLAILKQTEAGSLNKALTYNNWNGSDFFTQNTYEKSPEDYANHPGVNPNTGNTAAGAYQFLKRFYNESTFSPENQDKATVKNMTSKSYQSALSSNMKDFKENTSGRWISLDHWKEKQLNVLFKEYIIDELNGNSKIATPTGLLLLIREKK